MLKTFGRSIWHFFMRPAPTSVALMVGSMPDAANDDHAQLLRRAMRAASQPEEMAPAFETVAAEPKLTIVPAVPTVVPEAAAGVDEAEDERQIAEFEDDPEGGINEEADDAALALSCEEEPAAEVEERLDAAREDGPDEDGACAGPADEEVAAAVGAASPFESEGLDASEDGSADDDGPVASAADQYDDSAVGEPVEVARKVAQAPYVAALAELVDAVSGLQTCSAPADDVEALPEAAVAAEDADEVALLDDPVTSVLAEYPAETADPAETEPAESEDAAVVVAAEEEPVEGAPVKKTRKKRASSPSRKKSSTKSASRKGKAKAKDEAPAEPVPEDDVWVSDAVVWSLSGEWIDGEWHAPEDLDCPQRLEELRELAAEGKLTIWGRSDEAAVWQPIEAAYWKSGTVEPASLAEGRENVVAEPKTAGNAKSKRKPARKYSALKVSKSQIEEIWHPGAMH